MASEKKSDALIGLVFVVGIGVLLLSFAVVLFAPKTAAAACAPAARAVASAQAQVDAIPAATLSRTDPYTAQRTAARSRLSDARTAKMKCDFANLSAPKTDFKNLARKGLVAGFVIVVGALGWSWLSDYEPKPKPAAQPEPVYEYPVTEDTEDTEDWLSDPEPQPEPSPSTNDDRPRSGWGRSVNFGD